MSGLRKVNLFDVAVETQAERPEGYRLAQARLAPQIGARKVGATAYDLPPGQSSFPYHYEYGEEEWLLVLEGKPFLRTPEGTEELKPLDVAFFPRGPKGAHQVGNRSDERALVLMWSELTYPSATSYPDSDKVGVWTGVKPEDLMVERSANVDYYRGEKP